jgi:hypothetical protein
MLGSASVCPAIAMPQTLADCLAPHCCTCSTDPRVRSASPLTVGGCSAVKLWSAGAHRAREKAGGGGAAVQELAVPGTRLTRWRLRSRACAVIGLIVAAAGASLLALAALDSIVSWPSNRVLIGDRQLVPRHPTFALSPAGTCVARSTRVEEDGFAGGPAVGCAGGPLP